MATLSDFSMPQVMRRALLALCPIALPEERIDAEDLAETMVDNAELFLRSLAPAGRAAIVVGTIGFEMAAALRPSSLGRTFSRLPREQARAYFDSWWHSKNPALHNFAKGVKSMLAMTYYELPSVRQELRYHPDAWINKVARERLARFSDEIAAHAERLAAPAPLLDAVGDDDHASVGASASASDERRHNHG
ncbi:MAG: hypothetical protein KC503_22540 [Myxococcales bacterium]|nr:hypothetical protein [Myxococcales bacterium]